MTLDAPESGNDHVSLRSLSPSRASDFKRCPQLFKFSAIDRIPTPPTVYQARGTTAHLALERLFELAATERTPERLSDLFREAWQELKPGEFADLFDDVATERAWGIESLAILNNYFAMEDPTQIDPLSRELDMTQAVGNMTIRGILDRMEETPEGLVITDYKRARLLQSDSLCLRSSLSRSKHSSSESGRAARRSLSA